MCSRKVCTYQPTTDVSTEVNTLHHQQHSRIGWQQQRKMAAAHQKRSCKPSTA
jgi:hypothetical protein